MDLSFYSLALPSAGHGLAVVPILANVGVAVIPAIIAGLASVAAVLLSPRRMMAVCRRRPWVPLVAVMLVAGSLVFAFWPSSTGGGTARTVARTSDLSGEQVLQLARDYLDHQRSLARLAVAGRPLAAAAPATVSQTDAPGQPVQAVIYRADTGRSGYLGGGAPVDLARRWTANADRGIAMASVAKHGNLLFAALTELDPPHSRGSLRAFDAESGRERWRLEELPDGKGGWVDLIGFFSSPAVSADGRVLVVGQGLHFDRNCSLLGVDTATGALLWSVSTPLHIESSPAIDGDIVVVGAGAVEDVNTRLVKPGDNPGYVFAVRISTGEELWRHAVNDPESSPIVVDGIAYIGSGLNGNAVVALRARETDAELAAAGLSREIWRTPTPYPAIGAVTLAGDNVLIGGGLGDYTYVAPEPAGMVMALDRKTGTERWRLDTPDAVLGAIAVVGDRGIAPVRNGDLISFDVATGAVHWRRPAIVGVEVLTGPAFTGERIYVMTRTGWLVVMSAADGEEIERHFLNAPGGTGILGMTLSSPLVGDGRVWAGTETGGIVCLEGDVP